MYNFLGISFKKIVDIAVCQNWKLMKAYKEVKNCRICGNDQFVPVLDLGSQVLSGIFPESNSQSVPLAPLEMVKCEEKGDARKCGLLQLRHSADVEEMYGATYGYYSSLSPSMVKHLQEILDKLNAVRKLTPGDAVLDIGCNDGTLLKLVSTEGIERVGIDPSSKKFSSNFDEDITLICDYFSHDVIKDGLADRKFHQITAIAMFYDLDEPLKFLQDIRSILAEDGIWALELAYLPTMLTNLVYDQVCHEHVTYPALSQIEWLAIRAGLKIIDVEFNDVNGGSFLVIGCRDDGDMSSARDKIDLVLENEKPLSGMFPFLLFKERIQTHRKEVSQYFDEVRSSGMSMIGYGASTKGNIVLNYCNIGPSQLSAICDANPEKWGRVTPGSNIPIISKAEMRERNPDYLFVFIWHFHREVLEDEREFVMQGGKIVFDLPKLHIVERSNYEHHLQTGFSDYQFSLQ